ncbi:MAG: type II secretion system protein [Elusimicrobiota bacterium]
MKNDASLKLKIKKLLPSRQVAKSLSRYSSGFTLIELMIVVAIVGLLIAIVVPKFAGIKQKATEGATKGALGTIRANIAVYRGENMNTAPVLITNAPAVNNWDNTMHPDFRNFWKGDDTQLPENQVGTPIAPRTRRCCYNSNIYVSTSDITTNVNFGQGGWFYGNADGEILVNTPNTDLKGEHYTNW